jgi:transposase
MPRFKEMPMHPSQVLLFSQSVEEALPTESDVRTFNDVMECMSYSGIESRCAEVGCPPYPPKVMVKVLGYAYSKGIRSSRKIEEQLKIDVRFIWLAGGLKPDHNTLARFRKQNWKELTELFEDSVRVSCEAGLVFLNAVSTDGSKIEAAASRKRVYSQSRIERAIAAVEKVLQEAEDVDASEDEQYGTGSGSQLPLHLRDAKERKARLEAIAGRLQESKKKMVVEGEPESRVMKTSAGLRPAYNLQASVDTENQIIVAMKLTHNENDHGFLPEMVEDVESNTGLSPDVSLADTGYGDEKTLKWIEESGHNALIPLQEQPQESKRNDLFASKCFLRADDRDVLICPAGRELAYKGDYRMGSGTYKHYAAKGCGSCSFRDECVGKGRGSRQINLSIVEDQRRQMKERLESTEGRQLYQLRQESVEPVFGRIKENRGLRRFLLRGYTGALAETALACMAHNVSKCAASIAAIRYLESSRSPLHALFSLPGNFVRWLNHIIGTPALPGISNAVSFGTAWPSSRNLPSRAAHR